jgi:methylphosphotriester-DNA--protein-cysteine methyltransferase
VGDGSATRLEDVLHWLILARALALKTAERTWRDVAAELRVHPHTLSRFARQFTGLTLRAVATDRDAAAAMERALIPSFRE